MYQNVNNKFNFFQVFTPIDSVIVNSAGIVSDDHNWIVLARQLTPPFLNLYKFNGTKYESNHEISLDSFAHSIAMTADSLFMVAGTEGQEVEIFKFNGTKFISTQKLTYASSKRRTVSITNDHKYLTVV